MGAQRGRHGSAEGGEQGAGAIFRVHQSCNKVGVSQRDFRRRDIPQTLSWLRLCSQMGTQREELLSKLLSFIVWFVFSNEKMHPLHCMPFSAVLHTSTQWVTPMGSLVRQSTKPTWWDAQPFYCLTLPQRLTCTSKASWGLRSNLTTVHGLHSPGRAEKAALDRQDRTALVLMPQSKPDLIPPGVFGKCQEPGIPAFERQKQKDQKLRYIVSSRPVWAI